MLKAWTDERFEGSSRLDDSPVLVEGSEVGGSYLEVA